MSFFLSFSAFSIKTPYSFVFGDFWKKHEFQYFFSQTRLQAQDAGVRYSSSPYQPNIHSRMTSFGSNRVLFYLLSFYSSSMDDWTDFFFGNSSNSDFFFFIQIFSDMRCCYASCNHLNAQAICTSDCFEYKGTLDVFNKVARQVYNFFLLSFQKCVHV